MKKTLLTVMPLMVLLSNPNVTAQTRIGSFTPQVPATIRNPETVPIPSAAGSVLRLELPGMSPTEESDFIAKLAKPSLIEWDGISRAELIPSGGRLNCGSQTRCRTPQRPRPLPARLARLTASRAIDLVAPVLLNSSSSAVVAQ